MIINVTNMLDALS